ncbi:acyl-CoA dehydrogenase family protein [Photobacterium damselae subsp. piscicida]|nr:acyl-CoA dehydrogenase family protein [Photobacterium damselae subsp. piscicida]
MSEYTINHYPITAEDISERGQKAWDDMLNTINICKFNLGFASIGLCEHAFYEAINHAAHRNIYGKYVTDFPHIQRLFADAYARLCAMKLFLNELVIICVQPLKMIAVTYCLIQWLK